MAVIVMVLVVLAALLAVAGGVWVAVALISAIREAQPPVSSAPGQPVENKDE